MTSKLDSIDFADKGTVGKRRAERESSKGQIPLKHRAVELCEELIDASRGLEDQKSEYQLVTAYLNDIQKLEEMPVQEIDNYKKMIEKRCTHIPLQYITDHTYFHK